MPEFLPLVTRWVHIVAAITFVGGFLFIRFLLMPVLSSCLSDEDFARVYQRILKRWMMAVHICLTLLLASGLYNYLVVTRHLHPNQPNYHALFGVKFVVAVVVFFLAIALTSTQRWSAALRARPRLSYSALAVLAILIVLISGFLKNLKAVP